MDYIHELTPDLVGQRIKCRIEGAKVTEGKIYFENGEYFILNDVKDGGTPCENKQGYKCAWGCAGGTGEALQLLGVSAITILPPLHTFKKGDYVLITDGDTDIMKEFVGRIAQLTEQLSECLFGINIDGGVFTWTAMKHFKEAGVKSITPAELKNGETYVCINQEQTEFILRVKNVRGKVYSDRFIVPSEKRYSSEGRFEGSKMRTATIDEKVHLHQCIIRGRYRDFPKPGVLILKDTKIWVGEDTNLNQEVVKFIKDKGYKIPDELKIGDAASIYITKNDLVEACTWDEEEGEKKVVFSRATETEILPRHLGIGIDEVSGAPTAIDPNVLIDMILNNT